MPSKKKSKAKTTTCPTCGATVGYTEGRPISKEMRAVTLEDHKGCSQTFHRIRS